VVAILSPAGSIDLPAKPDMLVIMASLYTGSVGDWGRLLFWNLFFCSCNDEFVGLLGFGGKC